MIDEDSQFIIKYWSGKWLWAILDVWMMLVAVFFLTQIFDVSNLASKLILIIILVLFFSMGAYSLYNKFTGIDHVRINKKDGVITFWRTNHRQIKLKKAHNINDYTQVYLMYANNWFYLDISDKMGDSISLARNVSESEGLEICEILSKVFNLRNEKLI